MRAAALETSSRYTQSFSADEQAGKLAEAIVDPNSPDPSDTHQHSTELTRMLDLLDTLDERQQKILRMRFGLGYDEAMTLKEIGARLGLTRERVRQIQNEALARLFSSMSEGEPV